MSDPGPPPTVTVLMSVHNGEAHLKEAVDSVLAQTWRDFELLVVDDGSSDGTPGVLAAFTDPRIRVVRQENRGLAAALNHGLDLARGRYVARMDADDVCLPQRLERQVAALEARPEVDVLGAWAQLFGEREAVWRFPADPDTLRCRLLFHDVLVHPSVVLRRASFEREGLRYDPEFRYAQDYELWSRAAGRLVLANLPEVLLRLRVREAAPDRKRRRREREGLLGRIYTRLLAELEVRPTDKELALHVDLGAYRYGTDLPFLRRTEAWLLRLVAANHAAGVHPERVFRGVIGSVWLSAFSGSGCRAWAAVGLFARSPLSRMVRVRPRARALVRAAKIAVTAPRAEGAA